MAMAMAIPPGPTQRRWPATHARARTSWMAALLLLLTVAAAVVLILVLVRALRFQCGSVRFGPYYCYL